MEHTDRHHPSITKNIDGTFFHVECDCCDRQTTIPTTAQNPFVIRSYQALPITIWNDIHSLDAKPVIMKSVLLFGGILSFTRLLEVIEIILFSVIILTHISNAFQFPFAKNNNHKLPAEWTVRTCQNKDCCKQWTLTYQGLPEVLQDLLTPEIAPRVHVEGTGCLSLCGKGPNMELQSNQQSSAFTLNGMSGSMSLALELEERLEIEVPSKLIAAVTVLEKAAKGESMKCPCCSMFITFHGPGCNIRVANMRNIPPSLVRCYLQPTETVKGAASSLFVLAR